MKEEEILCFVCSRWYASGYVMSQNWCFAGNGCCLVVVSMSLSSSVPSVSFDCLSFMFCKVPSFLLELSLLLIALRNVSVWIT